MRLAPAPVLHLAVGASTVRAEAVRRGAVVWTAEATYASLGELAEAIARLAAEPAERSRRMRVTLERPPVQMRTLRDLPPVPPRELAALVAHQAGRFFRRNGSPLVTDAVWVSNGAGRVARAAAVEEPLLLAIVSGAREAGLHVERISPVGDTGDLQLLPTAERAARLRTERRLFRILAAASAGVWVGAALLFGVRLIMERRAVERELAAADAPLTALRTARRELRTVEEILLGVAEAKRGRGRALATLARAGGSLPDSAVILSFTWRADGSGLLAGAARRAADVLGRLERSGVVREPRFSGPVVREDVAGRAWERFTIIFGTRVP